MGRRRPTLPLVLLCSALCWPSSAGFLAGGAFFVPPSQSAASAVSSFPRRALVPLHARLHAKTEEDSRPDDSDGCGVAASPPVLTATTSRRSAILAAGAAAILPFVSSSSDAAHAATADDESLTTQLFNPDGSLRDASAAQEAKSRPVTATFPGGGGSTTTTTSLVSVDGEGPISASDSADSSSKSGKGVTVTYRIPDKWGPPSTGYLDKSEGVNARAADRITVYQTPYPAVVKTLDKASMTGVAKALGIETVPNYNPSLLSADLISGRRDAKRGDGNVYYEFDLAVAPQNCASGTKEDLGLGFCPYDSIVLLGATVVDGRMYGIMVECGREEWKRGSADLKRVRSSFLVEGELELLDK